MKIKAPYFLVLLTLCVTMLLAACGESAPTTAPASQPTTAASTTGANGTTAASATTAAATSASTTTAAQTTAPAAKTTAPATNGGSKAAKVNVCELFSQNDAEAALGVKVQQTPSKDNVAYYTCFYSTKDDGSLKIKDISYLSVLVYTKDATQSWYTSVKKEYEAQTAGKGLTQVPGLGNDAFYYVVNGSLNNGKGVHLSVLKDKTYFTIGVDNAKLDEAQQLAQLKDLAQKIATKL